MYVAAWQRGLPVWYWLFLVVNLDGDFSRSGAASAGAVVRTTAGAAMCVCDFAALRLLPPQWCGLGFFCGVFVIVACFCFWAKDV